MRTCCNFQMNTITFALSVRSRALDESCRYGHIFISATCVPSKERSLDGTLCGKLSNNNGSYTEWFQTRNLFSVKPRLTAYRLRHSVDTFRLPKDEEMISSHQTLYSAVCLPQTAITAQWRRWGWCVCCRFCFSVEARTLKTFPRQLPWPEKYGCRAFRQTNGFEIISTFKAITESLIAVKDETETGGWQILADVVAFWVTDPLKQPNGTDSRIFW